MRIDTALPLRGEVRILLVDPLRLFREGLRALVSTADDMRVVAEASSVSEAQSLAPAAKPDVAITEVTLPDGQGVGLARELGRRDASCRVLVLTAVAKPELVTEAIAVGVRGFALKTESGEAILEAVRAVARGDTYLAPGIPRSVLDRRASGIPALSPLELLSPREREIFDLILCGLTNESLARRLSISVKTIETHRASINKKLSVHSTAELVRFAALRGLI